MCHVTEKLKDLSSCDNNYIDDDLSYSLFLEEQSVSSASVKILSLTSTISSSFCDAKIHSAFIIEFLSEKSVQEEHQQNEEQNQESINKNKLIQELQNKIFKFLAETSSEDVFSSEEKSEQKQEMKMKIITESNQTQQIKRKSRTVSVRSNIISS